MTQTSSLSTLIELAERRTDAAAVNLGNAIRSQDELEQKLQLLQKYRDDYSRKMQTEMQSGKSMQQIRNFQVFLGKIDEAIIGQSQLVADAKKRVNHERNQWQEEERKRMSYTTLELRAEKVIQKKEAKREQKQNDEHANRQLFYKT
ncbi:flagellar export protein FliJ [Sapientia aquatica]|uniref:Flagellar FliJ protein n=1 Tax=Sapientia aquatica TaxID=1549640 RepID=A0A4R5W7C3_9BURK|nr:flagellar export protein FliJ [Sapientia aquatica]TDK68334.1 flagellar export protein FliJ [Sapientia aquatica]